LSKTKPTIDKNTSLVDLNSWFYLADLSQWCEDKNIPHNGTKKQLIARIRTHFEGGSTAPKTKKRKAAPAKGRPAKKAKTTEKSSPKKTPEKKKATPEKKTVPKKKVDSA